MTNGKVSENILKRSVLREIRQNNKDLITGAAFGEDCAILDLNSDVVMGMAEAVGNGFGEGRVALIKASNNLAACGFKSEGFEISVILPENAEEEDLKSLMKELSDEAINSGGQIIGGHTEVSGAVKDFLVTVTAFGRKSKEIVLDKKNISAGDAIIASKWIGIEGACKLLESDKEELTKRFGESFLERFDGYEGFMSVKEEAETAVANGVKAMKDVSEHGIFGALWDLGSAANKGLEVDLTKIPVKQEVIEICNHLNVSPYEMKSSGMLLMVTNDEKRLLDALENVGILAVTIGHFTNQNDRVIINDDEVRHLDKIKQDALYRR